LLPVQAHRHSATGVRADTRDRDEERNSMRIAFDLDDTMIPSHSELFAVEKPRGLLGRLFAQEHLRHGTAELLRSLTRQGCDLWVYTTSLRSPRAIRALFRWYGVRLGGAINQEVHWDWLRRQPDDLRRCSKYPPAFGIDLLVDDSEGVWLEGQQYRFQVVHVLPSDVAWTEKVLAAVKGRSPLAGPRQEPPLGS
jgi:hypothetical protein